MNERISTEGEARGPTWGKTTIDDMRRRKYSSRAAAGDLEVIIRRCENCGHTKAFRYKTGTIKCTRCRYEPLKKKTRVKKK